MEIDASLQRLARAERLRIEIAACVNALKHNDKPTAGQSRRLSLLSCLSSVACAPSAGFAHKGARTYAILRRLGSRVIGMLLIAGERRRGRRSAKEEQATKRWNPSLLAGLLQILRRLAAVEPESDVPILRVLKFG